MRLSVYLTRCNLIHPNSMAGLKGKTALDAVALLTADVAEQWDRKLPTYACFMDIKSCYPNIRHDILERRLEQYFLISGDILALIRDLLRNAWTSTIVNNSGSSPLLNLMFLDPLFKVQLRGDLFRLMIYVVYWSLISVWERQVHILQT